MYDEKLTIELANHYEEIIHNLGEDTQREGLLKTPERVAKAMQFLTNGYKINPDDLIKQAIFHEEYSEMVIVKDIDIYSMCEHHMLPYFFLQNEYIIICRLTYILPICIIFRRETYG
jgi:GTP cyclohydrolase I